MEKYGKYILISHHDLDLADRWFQRHGKSTVFFTRCMPVIRTFISFPAGMSHMKLSTFSIYTFLGALPWSWNIPYAYNFPEGKRSVEKFAERFKRYPCTSGASAYTIVHEYKAAVEEIGLAAGWIHGTHVAGIAAAGNPYARLVVARIEFDWHLIPDPCPTPELVAQSAASYYEGYDIGYGRGYATADNLCVACDICHRAFVRSG